MKPNFDNNKICPVAECPYVCKQLCTKKSYDFNDSGNYDFLSTSCLECNVNSCCDNLYKLSTIVIISPEHNANSEIRYLATPTQQDTDYKETQGQTVLPWGYKSLPFLTFGNKC